MKISELQAVLTKAQTLLGDAPIILKHAESEAETDIHGLEVLIESAASVENGLVTLVHGAAKPVQVETTEPATATPAS